MPSYDNIRENHKIDFQHMKYRPYSTVIILLLIWSFYLYGIFEIGWNNVHISATSPLSPNNSKYWFLSVSFWPQCSDLRSQAWRLLSLQFVHSGMLHIGGNSIGLLMYGLIVESYYCLRSVGIMIIFQSSVVLGALVENYYYPYEGLVGNSAGVYGLIGLSAAQLIMDYERMDEFVVFVFSALVIAQAFGDILSYFVMFNPTTAYLAHIAGYSCGFSLGLASYIWKPLKWRIVLSTIGLCLFTTEAIFFGFKYGTTWPPRVISTTYRNPSDATSCCAQLFGMISSNYSENEARENFICDGSHLYPGTYIF